MLRVVEATGLRSANLLSILPVEVSLEETVSSQLIVLKTEAVCLETTGSVSWLAIMESICAAVAAKGEAPGTPVPSKPPTESSAALESTCEERW